MGRKGSRLLPFLQSALIEGKYPNLLYEDDSGLIFSINLPHKTIKLNKEDEQLFKDWYHLNGKQYDFASGDYTEAKQAISASLRKSDYVEKVLKNHNKWTYRILDEAAVKEKKMQKKELKERTKVKKEAPYPDNDLSPVESGYASGLDSPVNDHAIQPLNGNVITSGGNELSEAFNSFEGSRNFKLNNTKSSEKSGYAIDSPLIDNSLEPRNDNLISSYGNELLQPYYAVETSSFLQDNGIQQSTYLTSGTLDVVPKSEAMDVSVSPENILTVPDNTTDLFENCFSKIQPYADNSSSENAEYLTPGLDLMECSAENLVLSSGVVEDCPDESKAINWWDFLQLENEEYASEMQNMDDQHAEFKDVATVNAQPSVTDEENILEEISPAQDPDLTGCVTGSREKLYLCDKSVQLGKMLVLFFEPQFQSCAADAPGQIKFVLEETVVKEIKGFKFKEHKFVNDHLMVFLEPNDD